MEFSKYHLLLFALLISSIVALFFIAYDCFYADDEFESETIATAVARLSSLEKEPLASHEEESLEVAACEPILAQPPEIINAVYLTSWSAGNKERIDYLFDLASTTEINAVVIDIKDYSGHIFYRTDVPEVKKYNAEIIRIADMDHLIQRLHQEGIYVIARITVFQDPVLSQHQPGLAIHDQTKLPSVTSSDLSVASLWLDNKGLAWIDAGAQPAWDYNIAVAKDAACRGFDEINFDYIRFPSDGELKDMVFPFWDEETPMREVLKEFFSYLRQELPEIRISADLFGLTTVDFDDLGIGQVIEDSFSSFDYVCPMIYPSHYSDWFLGYQNPAEHPYEVVEDSMKGALSRLMAATSSQSQLRPWLQDFDLGADYDAEMVKAQINAVKNVMGDDFNGFMLWSPRNIYTKEALEGN